MSSRLQAVPPPAGSRRDALLEELPAVIGLGLACSGIYILWGLGWTLIAAGAPFVLAYVARAVRFSRRGRPR